MIGADLLGVLLIEAAFEHTSLITRGAVRLEGTGVTGRRVALVAFLPFIVGMRAQRQDRIVRTHVNIPLRIIAKRLLAVDGSSLVKIGQWYIGSHVLVFHHHNIVSSAVGGITRDLTWPQFPAEAHVEDTDPRIGWFSITRRRGDQCGQDDARLASINHLMGMVAQMAPLPVGGHDGGIWIGRTDDKVCHAPIAATRHLPLWASCLLNPVMALLVGPDQVLS